MTGSRLADSRGRWLTDQDGQNQSPVCVLGKDAARVLFGFDDPMGKTIEVGGALLKVVGLVENRLGARLAGVENLNRLIYMHLEAGNALFGRTHKKFDTRISFERVSIDVDHLYIKVADVNQIENTVARLRTYLQATHEGLDYSIIVPYELLQQEAALQRIFTVVMGSIAAISLLVGGIGIMNIMLANIYERTREIGTRRALGARKRDILIQFLTESVFLTALGGVIGLFLGTTIAWSVSVYAGMRTDVTLISIVASLAVSLLTGVIFGTYPAWQAACLDPIEALRHE
jgi:putative ABC transport system permease protein